MKARRAGSSFPIRGRKRRRVLLVKCSAESSLEIPDQQEVPRGVRGRDLGFGNSYDLAL